MTSAEKDAEIERLKMTVSSWESTASEESPWRDKLNSMSDVPAGYLLVRWAVEEIERLRKKCRRAGLGH